MSDIVNLQKKLNSRRFKSDAETLSNTSLHLFF